ncbi:MAG: thioredoxin family protein [Sulfurovum sp.]|nr:thioredoxin family protein [Sulfurovum sp.]
MFKLLLLAGLSVSLLFSNELHSTPYTLVAKEIVKGEPIMIEVGSTQCYACQEMGKLLYSYMQKKPESKIFFVDVGKEREAARALNIQMIPTQIVYDAQGREVERHIGGMSAQELEAFLSKHGI